MRELRFCTIADAAVAAAVAHEVKTIPWKIGFTVPRLNNGSHVFARHKPRCIASHYCNVALYSTAHGVYLTLQRKVA